MNKKINLFIASLVLASSLAGSISAFAQTTPGSSASSTKNTARMKNLVTRADQEIARRIERLTALDTRLQSVKRISSDQKSSLDTTIQAQITMLANLKAKIDGDTDLATLLADVKSVTKSYRIYALIVPQTALVASADRVMTIVGLMQTLGGKLSDRITSAQSAGKDVGALQTALSDFNAKIADANAKAQAAVSEVSVLTPDNGDQAKMQSNLAAMKDARSKIQAAQQDLVAARKDAGTVVKGLRTFEQNATSSAAATSTGAE